MIEEDLYMTHNIYKYIEKAMAQAVYEKIDQKEFAGTLPCCVGVIAFGETLEECKDELLLVLEDWILVGLRLGHPLPVIDNINLNYLYKNKEIAHEKVGIM